MNLFDFIFYYSAKAFVTVGLHLFWDFKIINSEEIPPKGAVLLVGNHSSWIDTLILNAATKRPIWFATGDFILDVPVMRNIVKHLCILPMRKSRGQEGVKSAINKLKEGEIVCIFPEGELTLDGEVKRFRNGVSIIQKEADVPVVPFYIDGAFDIWSMVQKTPKFFKKMSVTFGKPFRPVQQKGTDVALEIKAKVIALKN